MISALKQITTGTLVRYLTRKVRRYEPFAMSPLDVLAATLQAGDILLSVRPSSLAYSAS